jgi:transposase-like protein
MVDLTAKIYHDENAARTHLERIHWPQGPECPHCGTVGDARRLKGESTRPGVYKCRACRKPFSVTVGTVMERSHIPLHKWVLASALLTASKKGISSHQLSRQLAVSYKSAWFLSHRIREAMSESEVEPLGGPGATIEADETYYGPTEHKLDKGKHGPANKRAVLGLVERGGRIAVFHIGRATRASVSNVIRLYTRREGTLMTDESRLYRRLGHEFTERHKTVRHAAGEYVRGDAHINTIESFWAVFKRGMRGIYQHCAEKHLHRYLNEFGFRANRRRMSDAERAEDVLRHMRGKRLTYRRTGALQGV